MRRNIGITFIIVGVFLIVMALVLAVYRYQQNSAAEENANTTLELLESAIQTYGSNVPESSAEPDSGTESPEIQNEETESGEETETEDRSLYLDGYDYIGILTIPSLNLELPVMSQWSYAGLKICPGRYSGSLNEDNLVICGHNYDGHFGQLRKLKTGDTVLFTDISGNVYTYEVSEVETLEATQIEEMVGVIDRGDWELTLFTCTPGGKTRLALRCIRTGESVSGEAEEPASAAS